jgi:hypothetical protein
MNPQLTRRQAIIAGAAGISGALGIAATGAGAQGGNTTVTLWRLNPNWGYDLTTPSGSSTKSRCKSNACHNAAPYRFFLTEAEAIAGRLHKCCLAQPEKVEMCLSLDALMPYYKARHGGVDARCPSLPDDVKAALVPGACPAPTTTTTAAPTSTSTTVPTATTPSAPAVTADLPGVRGIETDRNLTTASPTSLAFTGGEALPRTFVGAAMIAGGALLRLRQRRSAVTATAESATHEPDLGSSPEE